MWAKMFSKMQAAKEAPTTMASVVAAVVAGEAVKDSQVAAEAVGGEVLVASGLDDGQVKMLDFCSYIILKELSQ